MKKRLFSILLCCIVFQLTAQQVKKIEYEAEIQEADELRFPGASILIGNVKMKHEGIDLTCQKAIYYRKENFFKALGEVVIKQGDTITQTSDYADYDANTKQALSWGNVILEDPKMTLTTDTLQFDRLNQKLYYRSYATIQDENNTLNSKNGNYYLRTKKFTATTKVNIINENYDMNSDYLDYYTDSGTAYFYGPTTILSLDNNEKIYCEKGFYNTRTDISHFVEKAKLFLEDRTIEGDSLYYDKNKGFASATKNIRVIDTVQNFVTKGNYAELFQEKDSMFIVDRAVAISIIEQDSMFVHGDTLLITGEQNKRIIRTFHNVKIFKSNLQGKCDSIYTNQETGYTKMYKNPVIWSEINQITGDSIFLKNDVETQILDSLKVFNNALIVSKDSLSKENFNQIRGRNMFGQFADNQLKNLFVDGNAETVYFNRNEETQLLETITKEISSSIEFTLLDGQVESIKYLKSTEGTTYPPYEADETVRRLKGFIWREDERPKSKSDIFKTKIDKEKSIEKSKDKVKPNIFDDNEKVIKNLTKEN